MLWIKYIDVVCALAYLYFYVCKTPILQTCCAKKCVQKERNGINTNRLFSCHSRCRPRRQEGWRRWRLRRGRHSRPGSEEHPSDGGGPEAEEEERGQDETERGQEEEAGGGADGPGGPATPHSGGWSGRRQETRPPETQRPSAETSPAEGDLQGRQQNQGQCCKFLVLNNGLHFVDLNTNLNE